MVRKPEYSFENFLNQAIDIVVERGYKACSMNTLISQTGFNRRAFYSKFENKDDFIIKLLSYYLASKLSPLQSHLIDSQNTKQAIVNYFKAYQSLIEDKGCLLINLILELGENSQIGNHIQKQARAYFDNLQLSFIACLEKSTSPDATHRNNIEVLALKLSFFAQGFAVSNKVQQGKSDVFIVIESLFASDT